MRADSGKSSVAYEIHDQLSSSGVMHACIEGDNLDLAYPPPWEHGLAAQNLAAMWRNYRALGYRRLIYTNTVSVLHAGELAAALGGEPTITGVLLTANDATIHDRLAAREVGGGLQAHLGRSRARARAGSASPQLGAPRQHRQQVRDRGRPGSHRTDRLDVAEGVSG